jgi:hypothetical protein
MSSFFGVKLILICQIVRNWFDRIVMTSLSTLRSVPAGNVALAEHDMLRLSVEQIRRTAIDRVKS